MTLLELLLAIVVGMLAIGGVVAVFMVVQGNNIPPVYSYTSPYGTHDFRTAPSAVEYQRSVEVIGRLQEAMDSANAVFVLGGNRSAPQADAASGALPPLAVSSLPTVITSMTLANIPQTSYAFRALVAALPGVQFETTSSASDFTVMTMTGAAVVSTITQVRRYSATIDGASLVLYEVVHDTNLAATRDDVEGSPTRNRYAYRMALPASEDVWAMPPGALHFWFRSDPYWRRYEEAPARLVFPDPFLLAGEQPGVDTAPFSRYIFYVSPTT